MKRYLRHVCTVCKRHIDKPVDNLRALPDKCVITLNCLGRLLPIEYRSNGEIAVNAEAGVSDWFPRGRTQGTEIAIQPTEYVDTSTGALQQLTVGIRLPAAPLDTATANLQLLRRSETPVAYRQYTYRFGATFQSVAGIEDGVEKKTLRFVSFGANQDSIEVFLNGVKQERGIAPDQYQIYDGTPTSSVPQNIIQFNSQIPVVSTTQVDVIVSRAEPASISTVLLKRTFDNDARQQLGSWENVSFVERITSAGLIRYYLFTFDVKNNTSIQLNTQLIPYSSLTVASGASTQVVNLSDAIILLSRAPYTQVDRYTSIISKMDTFSFERDYLRYVPVDKKPVLQLTKPSLFNLYPPLRLTKFNAELPLQKPVQGISDQLVIDGRAIVGPDA